MRRPSYEYQPLQHDDSIRLLILHPSPNESDPIACTIRHAQLSSTARYPKVYPAFFTYEAVSYTWGYSTQWTAISFNNGKEELSVGENCHAALRRLRKPTADRSIWIDAVCINQQDLTERSMQVRMMNEIYTRAIGIVVMLSDQVPDCRLLLDEAIIVNNLLRHTDVIPRGRPTKAIIRQLEVLFEDPWFKRTWVLQEVYKKYQIVIMYGSALIALPVLKQICYGYGNRKLTRGVLPRPLALVWGSETEYSTPQFNLWNRLYESRECLASNPRDKVFALKSLLGHRQSEIDNLIDYVQSVEQCFKRVAEFLLPVLGIRILAATRHPHEMGMASWIPDWSQDGPLQSTAFHFESDKARMLGNMSMSATAGDYERATKSCLYKDLPTGPELHVTGCRYARIVKSSQVFGFFDAEHAERQMQMVYNDFDNLRQRLQSRAKRKTTPFTLAHFGRKLFQGKGRSCAEYGGS